jgi:hypothetical protein
MPAKSAQSRHRFHGQAGLACRKRPLPSFLASTERKKMNEGKIMRTWIAAMAVIAIVLGSLVFFSNGPLPYIQPDQSDLPPFWG